VTGPSARVLIVDDEPANRRLLADLVSLEKIAVTVASGGAEALQILARERIDLVFLDLMMPEVDGMAVLAELRRKGVLPALPVVVVTAHDDRQARLAALSAGAIDFLGKPIDRAEVRCKLHTLIELKQLRDAANADAAGTRAQLAALLEHAPDFVLSLDRNGIVRYGNRVLPWDEEECVVGSSWAGFASTDEERAARQAALDQVLATGLPSVLEIVTRDADGSQSWFELRIGPVPLDGKIDGTVIIGRDVTAKKRTEMQLMISDRMASVGTLAAGVAHEINNPLAAVMANLELALRDIAAIAPRLEPGEVADLQDELRDARDAADSVRLIVRDLKVFSRADEEAKRDQVDVRKVLESTLRMCWNEIRHRARLVKDYGQVPLVLANESRLGQVFLNLVVNAAQAIPEGNTAGNEIRIVTSVGSAGRVRVDIRDTGPGIPPEVRNRLFTPFFTTKPVGLGTGLGLSICHRLVTDIGGEIHVESEVGRGTTFWVLLPPAVSEMVETARAAAPSQHPAFRRGRVLVVDDEPMIGRVIRRTLAADHDVTVVDRAQEALDLIVAAGPFDVIFCDLMMPQMTGMDFHEEMCGRDPEQASRIVFLTGGAFTPRARDFLDRVTNLRVEKPFDAMQLRTLVNDRIR
jgi:PAS domain S-box-containing protein